MSYTSITPFLPFIRLAIALLALVSVTLAVLAVRRSAAKSSLGAALRAEAAKVGLAAALAVAAVWVLTGASSAFRPKDAIEADYSAREQMLRRVDQAAPPMVAPSKPQTPDWDAARGKFRDQVTQEQQRFERATGAPDKAADKP